MIVISDHFWATKFRICIREVKEHAEMGPTVVVNVGKLVVCPSSAKTGIFSKTKQKQKQKQRRRNIHKQKMLCLSGMGESLRERDLRNTRATDLIVGYLLESVLEVFP